MLVINNPSFMSIFTPDRDLEKLTPEMKRRVERFIRDCADSELPVFVTEGFRSRARQRWLYSFGRYGENKAKGKVTWTLQSNHMRGQAIDIAFRGKELYPKSPSMWEKAYDIAAKHGLISLYRASGFDRPHINYDNSWIPKPNRRQYEDELIRWGIVTLPKNLDLPPTREEFYKIVMELFKRNRKKITDLEKEIKKLTT